MVGKNFCRSISQVPWRVSGSSTEQYKYLRKSTATAIPAVTRSIQYCPKTPRRQTTQFPRRYGCHLLIFPTLLESAIEFVFFLSGSVRVRWLVIKQTVIKQAFEKAAIVILDSVSAVLENI